MDLGTLTIENAQALTGTSFQLTLPDGRTTGVKLEEAVAYNIRQRRRGPEPKRTPFSLLFLGDPAVLLPQGMYTISSESLTLEGIFLVPVARDEEATEYEAIFT